MCNIECSFLIIYLLYKLFQNSVNEAVLPDSLCMYQLLVALMGRFCVYKDGPKLPLLNFSTTCITSGRYVIFYNERLDGVIYPTGYENSTSISMELCDVVVNGK